MASYRALVDGEPRSDLPVVDRGFSYGDGVFRTIRMDQGRGWLLEQHLAKLRADAARLGMAWPAELDALLQGELAELVAGESGTLRLVMTRGSGPRGDRPPADPVLRRLLLFYPGSPPAFDGAPRAVRLCRTPMPYFPPLAGVKHLNRLPQVLARQEWVGPDPAEGLMPDPEGRLLCGTMSNLFVRQGRTLFTPALGAAGVAGVVRNRLLSEALPTLVTQVVETQLTTEDLVAAEEAFVTNAVIGLWPLGQLLDADGVCLRVWQPGDAELAAALLERWRSEL